MIKNVISAYIVLSIGVAQLTIATIASGVRRLTNPFRSKKNEQNYL